MPGRIRKCLTLDPADIEDLLQIARSKGGRPKGYTLSSEVNAAIRDYTQRHKAKHEETILMPAWQQLLEEKFAQLEAWLRPGVWGGGTYSTTAALLLLELMCGKTLDPAQARDHFDLIRGRAWKLVRREGANPTGSGEGSQ